MKEEIALSKCLGKTLAGYAFSITCCQAVMTFTDGTFATIGISRGWDPGEIEFIEEKLNLHDFGDDKLICLGVITQSELNEMRDQKVKESLIERENAELALYEKLRNKFES